MKTLLKNKFIRYGLFGLCALLVVCFLAVLYAFFVIVSGIGGRHLGLDSLTKSSYGGAYSMEVAMDEGSASRAPAIGQAMVLENDFAESVEYYPVPVEPIPVPGDYTAGLEKHETTSYNLYANTRDLDELCKKLEDLKAEKTIHFKYLNTDLNNCSARFFVEEDRVTGVLAMFKSHKDININRNTESVTRHKEQLGSRSAVIRKQLTSVEETLAEAEVAYDEIVSFARNNRDAATLSEAIREKLQQIDYLTQRKISMTAQLDNLAQQAIDLNERLDVVEFYTHFNRSNPIHVGEQGQKWEQAWEELKDRFTETLIGVTTMFVVFLLYILQFGLYLLTLILVARFGWKVIKMIWRL